MTLIEFLNERLDEDEQAARAAIIPARPGTHWQWIAPDDDGPAQPDRDGYVRGASLRTVEEYTTAVGRLPGCLIDSAGEMTEGAAAHIARYDPARVLREIAYKRAIVKEWQEGVERKDAQGRPAHLFDPTLSMLLKSHQRWLIHMASAYSDHPDYRQE